MHLEELVTLYIYMICVCDSVFAFQALEQLFGVWQNESVR